jgi:hypothetical protein
MEVFMRTFAALLSLLLASGLAVAAEGYRLLQTIPVAGDGGWDYVTVDEAGRRV